MMKVKTKKLRKIIRIDEEKCNGCGLCVSACAEGAIQIIDGKAKLVKEEYCDGLGACLGHCPQGAITIEEREAEEFSEEAVKTHLESLSTESAASQKTEEQIPCSCPSLEFEPLSAEEDEKVGEVVSQLSQWPIQLALVPPKAPYFQGTHLLVVADCVSFAQADFHQRFLREKTLVIGCPKLDDIRFYINKLADIFRQSEIKKITVIHMEVPCCFGLVQAVKVALVESNKDIPADEVTVSIRGEVLEEKALSF